MTPTISTEELTIGVYLKRDAHENAIKKEGPRPWLNTSTTSRPTTRNRVNRVDLLP